MKYIYFETYEVTGSEPQKKTIRNENLLVFQPHTNSEGVWSYRNMTERHGFETESFAIVDQYWVDIDKYVPDKNIDGTVQECILKLKQTSKNRWS